MRTDMKKVVISVLMAFAFTSAQAQEYWLVDGATVIPNGQLTIAQMQSVLSSTDVQSCTKLQSTGAGQGSQTVYDLGIGGAASLEVSWPAPTTRVDGTIILPDEVAKYKVDWGTSTGSYSGTLFVAAPVTYIQLTGLTADQQYFFQVTTIDTEGRESTPSTEIATIAK